jgi:hypothetical protein
MYIVATVMLLIICLALNNNAIWISGLSQHSLLNSTFSWVLFAIAIILSIAKLLFAKSSNENMTFEIIVAIVTIVASYIALLTLEILNVGIFEAMLVSVCIALIIGPLTWTEFGVYAFIITILYYSFDTWNQVHVIGGSIESGLKESTILWLSMILIVVNFVSWIMTWMDTEKK